jgi:hypothetical protein
MLALRNLERGRVFGLPSGQDVALALGVEPIPNERLLIGEAAVEAHQKSLAEIGTGFPGGAPLWTYILAEAQLASWDKADLSIPRNDVHIKLGPVGSRIIADVFAALLIGDGTSFLYADPRFEPIPEFTRNGAFGLAQLINVALGHTP